MCTEKKEEQKYENRISSTNRLQSDFFFHRQNSSGFQVVDADLRLCIAYMLCTAHNSIHYNFEFNPFDDGSYVSIAK